MENTRSSGDPPYLPEDLLIDEILVRLPVKSLRQFKCVCKNWYNLVKSPRFIRDHFNNPNNHTRLLVRHFIRSDSDSDSDWENNFDSDSFNGSEPQNPLAISVFPDETLAALPLGHQDVIDFIQRCPNLHEIHMIGPINGLFLLHTAFDGRNARLALWNPATTEFRRLPKPKFRFPVGKLRCVSGFGLDLLTKDYKVVWIPTFWSYAPHDLAAVALYTPGTDESWRQIENPHVLAAVPGIWWKCHKSFDYCTDYFSGEYLNGAFYWLVECNCGQRIVLFDMGRDVFRKIPAPHNVNATSSGNNRLVQIDDSIALLENEYISIYSSCVKFIHVWVMKEEGCWTKRFTLGREAMVKIRYPLGFWKNSNELFVETATGKLVLYDLNTQRVKDLGVCGGEGASFLQVFKYKESLVSIKGGQKENWSRDKLRYIIMDFLDVSELTEDEDEEEGAKNE
ncbi:hypothetical protein LguiB_031459 [Lonicera macranthoides]